MVGDEQTPRLARDAARGVVWALVGSLAGKFIWLAALGMLARFVTPEQFGLVAFGLVTITYLEAVGDLGSGAALIYWPPRDARDLETTARVTFWVNLGMGLVFCATLLVLAPLIGRFFHHPEGVPVLRALALGLPVKFLGTTHDALLRKKLKFRHRALPEAGLSLAKAAIAVPLALGGFGAWSLVWGQIGGLLAWTALLWSVEPWRPSLEIRMERLHAVLRYGRGIVAVDVLAAIVHHADLVVVGRMAGAAALGYYQIAYKLPEMTLALAIWIAGSVLFPTLSRMHGEGGDLATGLRAAIRHTTAATFPLAAGLALLSEPVIRTVFGQDWLSATPLLAALAIYLGVRSWGSAGGDLMKSAGKPHWLAGLALARAIVLVPALIFAGRHGTFWVAWTMAGMAALSSAVNLAFAARIARIAWWRTVGSAAPALAASIVMAVGLLAWRLATPDVIGPGGLALRVLAGAAVYVVTLRVLAPELMHEAWTSLRRDHDGRPSGLGIEVKP